VFERAFCEKIWGKNSAFLPRLFCLVYFLLACGLTFPLCYFGFHVWHLIVCRGSYLTLFEGMTCGLWPFQHEQTSFEASILRYDLCDVTLEHWGFICRVWLLMFGTCHLEAWPLTIDPWCLIFGLISLKYLEHMYKVCWSFKGKVSYHLCSFHTWYIEVWVMFYIYNVNMWTLHLCTSNT
jgi:hypothetical protein